LLVSASRPGTIRSSCTPKTRFIRPRSRTQRSLWQITGTKSNSIFFGDGSGTQANFNSGSIIDVGIILADGTNNAPICATSSNAGTAEANSLTLLQPCYQLSGASNWGVLPGIEFTESNVPTPTVLSVTPTTGPVTGGVKISIGGTNFTNVSSVLIGTLPATSFSVSSASSVTAVVPAFAGGQISVTTPNGVAVGAGYFPYPIVTSVSPASGPIRGGIGVTASGIGMPNDWATPFSFGGVHPRRPG
jgi:hypothetical protein